MTPETTCDNTKAPADSQTPEDKKVESENSATPDAKKIRGWPDRQPFYTYDDEGKKKHAENQVYWSDLTWNEKFGYRKAFFILYFNETRKCLPYVRRLLGMIFRISPWRAAVIFAVNIAKSLLPALTLKTRGSFIMMV